MQPYRAMPHCDIDSGCSLTMALHMTDPAGPPAGGQAPTASPSGPQDAEEAKISVLLADLARGNTPRIALGEMLDLLRERGFALLILLLALPNAIPGPAIPGLSTITGLPLALIALQLALGRIEPRLPEWVRRKSVPRTAFQGLVTRANPWLQRLESLIRPRMLHITSHYGERLIGAWIVISALFLSLPVPLGNLPMAAGLMVLAIGLMERDGVAILLGLAHTALGVIWNLALLWAGGEMIDWLWGRFG
jgi:hypothetical protein